MKNLKKKQNFMLKGKTLLIFVYLKDKTAKIMKNRFEIAKKFVRM